MAMGCCSQSSGKDGEMLSSDKVTNEEISCLNLVVQGKPLQYRGSADVRSLLESRGENPMYVNVRINDEVLGHRDFEHISLHDGDSIDFLYYMGGGTCLTLQMKKSSGIRGI